MKPQLNTIKKKNEFWKEFWISFFVWLLMGTISAAVFYKLEGNLLSAIIIGYGGLSSVFFVPALYNKFFKKQ